jgi:ubiquinone/menaquinone biosynthesis C-methylase UbiE
MKSLKSSMQRYYAARSPVYDLVYLKPERQADLRHLKNWIPTLFRNKNLLEIACGTGYWTQYIAPVTSTMCAVDITEEVIQQARLRTGVSDVAFMVADAYHLSVLPGAFDAAFAGLWVSHIPRQELPAFFAAVQGLLQPGSPVLVIDNSKEQCKELPITETDQDGNTYQTRALEDGSHHKVLKNFPTREELQLAIAGVGTKYRFQELEHFWTFQFETL